jgi:hypothetical protein
VKDGGDEKDQSPKPYGWGELLLERARNKDVIRMRPEPEAFQASQPAAIKQRPEVPPLIARLARRRSKVAERISDNAMIIAVLAFYCGRLQLGQPRSRDEVEVICPKKFKPYLQAARWLLGIRYDHARNTFKLPFNYLDKKLFAIGLRLWINPTERIRFEKLNHDLILDDDMIAFANDHPEVLEAARRRLKGCYKPTDNELLSRPPVANKVTKSVALVVQQGLASPQEVLDNTSAIREGLNGWIARR